ncbi:MarR family winged helix-turn-helix transcriptional regulator [Bacillus cytotoxicus]|uniref:MarR family winged helix-turn-helix transcriptional regulator n=1 Tax=Bacillus cytotoxicus TaxID=580165 RepID=UPI000661551A|nr:MarR family transcriptional regulator [Bacillus cytotoxicus]AWC32509.1 MarR family transcriptional regulator [Bacillus cytotoxicus]AWC36537.1 MarR family transcriptional regulator [Bacillus cytotoxicus]AWC60791.1 MarR family transcriptional regulator [Bacillus cytotoxicus]KMT50982.1 MarR family transcriptional regulator [Bacillus cytotoxicus]HDR7308717.1 MarR family transcriptional regulator [Bacillus cytotoxicus]
MNDARELFQVFARRFGFLNKNCCSIGGVEISLVQSHILCEISKRDQPSMQIVSEALGMDITTFSRQIQTLVKKKFVAKTPSPQDRRIHTLSLTTEGTFVVATINEQMNQYLNEVFSKMSPFEKDMILNSIQLLNNAMQDTDVCCKPLA